MIDLEEFKRGWKNLCARFAGAHEPSQAAAYYEYLSEQMTTEEFLGATRSLWATSRFFPRPADFVLAVSSDEWGLVLAAVEAYTPPRSEWVEFWNQTSARSQAACRRMGGLSAMRTMYERDVVRLKTEWERCYEQETAKAALILPSASRPQLPAAPADLAAPPSNRRGMRAMQVVTVKGMP